ncbi:hypothetical protein QDZ26_003035 [Pluralibacter gergoviae]|nr:hypothetical protein [Pluralibacter gergoviae]
MAGIRCRQTLYDQHQLIQQSKDVCLCRSGPAASCHKVLQLRCYATAQLADHLYQLTADGMTVAATPMRSASFRASLQNSGEYCLRGFLPADTDLVI